MKTLYKIPYLLMLAAVLAMGLGYGYNCVADKPLAVKAIPLTPDQRDACREVGISPNDMQLARWGSEAAMLRIETQIVGETSKRARAAFVAQDTAGMEDVGRDIRAATNLINKLTR